MCVVSPILLLLLLCVGVGSGVKGIPDDNTEYIDAEYEVIDEDV